MTTTVVIMIIIGLIIIIASFFVTEKLTKKEDNTNLDLMTVDENYEFSERELNIIKRKIEDVIANHAKDIIYETNESLSFMANEKTIALGDYAVSVCDEIEKNHKEVMFLYSMLEDKQKDIMKTVQAVDRASEDIKEILSKADELASNMRIPEKSAEPVLKQQTEFEYYEEEEVEISPSDIAEESDFEDDFDDLFDGNDELQGDIDTELEQEFTDNENSNEIILEMYRNGESIINIAKQLGLGVGEVKLVIDLYQGE